MIDKTFEVADTIEVKAREREIRLLINIQQPDPEYQPFIFTDDATVFDISGDSEKEINEKYSFYFKDEFLISFHMPLWKLVDAIKQKYIGWPDNWPFLH